MYPIGHAFVELVVDDAKRQQRTHVEKILHGKSASISSTSLLVRTGAPGPNVRAGNPVTGSITIFPLVFRFLCGVKTIRSPSALTSSESPGWSPSRRRTEMGSTTCPLVEILVTMVRRSYHQHGFAYRIRVIG